MLTRHFFLPTGTPFYYNNQGVQQAQGPALGPAGGRVELGGEMAVKSPLAATRANSGASAASPASPTGTACLKQEPALLHATPMGTPTGTPTEATLGQATSEMSLLL